MLTKYSINVRREPRNKKDKYPFVLYNHDAVTGNRLFKGEKQLTKKNINRWPMKHDPDSVMHAWDCGWNRFKTENEARIAAKALQRYLEATE